MPNQTTIKISKYQHNRKGTLKLPQQNGSHERFDQMSGGTGSYSPPAPRPTRFAFPRWLGEVGIHTAIVQNRIKFG